jgi:hypothetical protein
MRHLDLEASAGLCLDGLGELHGRLMPRIARRGAVAEGELDGACAKARLPVVINVPMMTAMFLRFMVCLRCSNGVDQ